MLEYFTCHLFSVIVIAFVNFIALMLLAGQCKEHLACQTPTPIIPKAWERNLTGKWLTKVITMVCMYAIVLL